MGAVDHWFNGDNGANQELLDDLAAYGADISALPESMREPETFEVWPEHLEALEIFLRCTTQWRTTQAGVIGLDYGPMFQLLDLYAVGNRLQVFEDLQIMEQRAVKLINDKIAKDAPKAGKGGRR